MSVAFEPEPLRRRRRPDRAVLLTALAVVFLGLATAKPWAPGPSTGVSPAPSASPAPSDGEAGASGGAGAGEPTTADVLAAVPAHDAWGLRVLASPLASDPPAEVVRLRDGTRLLQRWTAVDPVADAPGGSLAAPFPAPGAIAADAGGPIRFLGITSPSRDPALDVRVWRVGPDVPEPRWLDVRLAGGDLGLGEWLLGPPWVGGAQLAEWPAGTYRVDVLRAGSIGRLTVHIAAAGSRPASVPAEPRYPGANPSTGGSLPSLDQPGPLGFVVADGQAISLPGRLGPPLDERSAWLAAASASDIAPAVVHGHVPDATGIGLLFPARATSIAATLVRLAPSFDSSFPAARTGRLRGADGDVPWAVVDAPAGGAFAPGSYRLDVSWRDGTGDRSYGGSIHLELEPGPIGLTPRWLSAARGMARWAGSSGFVVGISGRIEGASTDSLMRLLPETPGTAPTTVEALGDTCAGAVIAVAGDAVLGLVHSAAAGPVSVAVERLFAGGHRLDVPVRAAVEVVPGLVLMAPGGDWAPGHYRVTLEEGGATERSVVCLAGASLPLRVPVDASSAAAWSALASAAP